MQIVLAHQFYGTASDNGQAKLDILVKAVQADALFSKYLKPNAVENEWRLASYTSPFTLPPFAKKDVWIQLPELSAEEAQQILQQAKQQSEPSSTGQR